MSGTDGIPDLWKANHGFSPTANIGATTAPNGYTYLENYLNGTDPNVTAQRDLHYRTLAASLSRKLMMRSSNTGLLSVCEANSG